jgi:polar amino acid transport system substrate-binding protein
MIKKTAVCLCLWMMACIGQASYAQDYTIATVTRSPFSIVEDGKDTGFSLDLFAEVAKDLEWNYTVQRFDTFTDMLGAVQDGAVDAAIANISVTASREAVMDFSQPIFAAGLQIMVKDDRQGVSAWSSVISKDIVLAIALAFTLLLGAGMLMWRFERHHEGYFHLPAREAMFPAFWWALNLILNGGFEERQPRSPLGRLFGVILVISSLFFVSVFVARITTIMTVEAIQSNVSQLSDLYGKNIGTISHSTSSEFLNRRDLNHTGYDSIDEMFASFEAGDLDAIIFDAPILAYYANNNGKQGHLIGKVFVPENYGIALSSGSPLAEPINQSLLKLREDGTYDRIYSKWFGVN